MQEDADESEKKEMNTENKDLLVFSLVMIGYISLLIYLVEKVT